MKVKTRQIIQCRVAATLSRPQINQDTCLRGGGAVNFQNLKGYHRILTSSDAVHPTDVSENYSNYLS